MQSEQRLYASLWLCLEETEALWEPSGAASPDGGSSVVVIAGREAPVDDAGGERSE